MVVNSIKTKSTALIRRTDILTRNQLFGKINKARALKKAVAIRIHGRIELPLGENVLYPVVEERLKLESLPPASQKKLSYFDRILSERMERKIRLGGEPAINHYRRMVNKMIEDGIRDNAMLLAGLGHDAVEDKYMALTEVQKIFGKDVWRLIDGVTKLSKEEGEVKYEQGSLIKLVEAASLDPRVIIVKHYDNDDNWRDQHVFLKIPGKEGVPLEHAEETMQTYVPMLRAFNCWLYCVRLEDKALEYYDRDYKSNLKIYNKAIPFCQNEIREIAAKIQQKLDRAGIKARVTHRVKRFSEISRNCGEKDLSMKALFKTMPLFAHYISVVTEDDNTVTCHTARGKVDKMGISSGLFNPEAKTICNLIHARENGYRAMHTYASLPQKGNFMIGYTTKDFDLSNRFGIVADGIKTGFEKGWAKTDHLWLMRLRSFIREAKLLTVSQIRKHIPKIATSIRVYTPEREACEIPEDSTALDFAVSRSRENHLNIGNIFVNGKKVNFDFILKPEDVVDVKINRNSIPHPNWLLSVHNPESAKNIRIFLRTLSPARQEKLGTKALNRAFRKEFLTWDNIKDSLQMAKVLGYLSEKYKEKLDQLVEKKILSDVMWNGKELFPRSLEILVGLGEMDIEEAVNKFNEVYRAALQSRKKKGEKKLFAILFKVHKDRIGIQMKFAEHLERIGFNIIKNLSGVNPDGSASLSYAFDIYSSLQERQIENIVKKFGEMLRSERIKEEGEEFKLTEWAKKEKVVI